MNIKTKKLQLTIFLIMLTVCTGISYGQVTIGSGLEPVPGSLLDLKEYNAATAGGVTSNKGLNLTRVKLTDINNLYPMFETSPGSGAPNSDYDDATKKAAQDAIHTGLTVYNVNTENGFTECVYVWVGNKWIDLCGTSSTVCPLELKDAPSGGKDMPTGIIDNKADSIIVYAIKGSCCNMSGDYVFDIVPGTGFITDVALVDLSRSNKATGKLNVWFKTENKSVEPRVALIKVTDPCGNTAYFTAMQKGIDESCPLKTESGIYMETVSASGSIHTTSTKVISSCCPIDKDNKLKVTSNMPTVTSNIQILDNGTFQVGFFPNTSLYFRTVMLTLEDACGNKGYYFVVQSPAQSTGCSISLDAVQMIEASATRLPSNIAITLRSCCTVMNQPWTFVHSTDTPEMIEQHTNPPSSRDPRLSAQGDYTYVTILPTDYAFTVNTGKQPRFIVATVTDACNNDHYITIIQKGDTSSCPLTIAPNTNTPTVPYTGGETQEVTVTSDCCPIGTANQLKTPVSSESYATIVSLDRTKGTFKVQFSENGSATSRTAIITVEDNCGNKGYFVAVQEGKPTPATCDVKFNTNEKYRIVKASGETFNLTASSCCTTAGNWSFTSSNTGLIGNNTVSGTVSGNPSSASATYSGINVPANNSSESRTIIITATDPCNNTGYYVVMQEGAVCPVNLDLYTHTLPFFGGSDVIWTPDITIIASSCCTASGNYTYTVVSGANLTSSSADVEVLPSLDTKSFKVRFKTDNFDDMPRVARIKVTDPCGNAAYFDAVQEGSTCIMGTQVVNIGAAGGNLPDAITMLDFCCTSPHDWYLNYDNMPMLQASVSVKTPEIVDGYYSRINILPSEIQILPNTNNVSRYVTLTAYTSCADIGYVIIIQEAQGAVSNNTCNLTFDNNQAFREVEADATSINSIHVESCCTATDKKWKLFEENIVDTIFVDNVVVQNHGSATFTNIPIDANPDAFPRVIQLTIKDPCGNTGYFTVVQKPKRMCPITFDITSGQYYNVVQTSGIVYGEIPSAGGYFPTNSDERISAKTCCTEQFKSIEAVYTSTLTVSDFIVIPHNNYEGSGIFRTQFLTPNPSSDPRIAVVKVTDGCGNIGYVTVVQKGTTPAVTACALDIPLLSQTIDAEATSISPVTIISPCCTGTSSWVVSFEGDLGMLSNAASQNVTPVRENGKMQITVRGTGNSADGYAKISITANTSETPRVLKITIEDACGNKGYAVIVQKGKTSTACAITFKGTSPAGVAYSDHPYVILGPEAWNNITSNPVTAESTCCPYPLKSITITGGNFDNTGNSEVELYPATTSGENTRLNTGVFNLRWKTANANAGPRIALVKVVDDCDNVGYFTVIQRGASTCALSLNPYIDIVSSANEATTQQVMVTSSCCPGPLNSVTVTSGASYARIINFNADKGWFEVQFTSENQSTEPRQAVITIEDACENKGYFVAVQKGTSTSTSTKCDVTFNNQYKIVPESGETFSITAYSSCCTTAGNWSFTSNNHSLIGDKTVSSIVSANSSSATYSNITVPANNYSESRTVLVTVTDPCGNTGYYVVMQEGKKCAVTFTSDRPYAIIPSAQVSVFTDLSSCCPTQSFSVDSYTSSSTDFNILQPNITSNKLTVTFTASNTSETDRTVVVKVKDNCGNIGYFTVVQKGTSTADISCALNIPNVSQSIPAGGGQISPIQITSPCCTSSTQWTVSFSGTAGMLALHNYNTQYKVTPDANHRITINSTNNTTTGILGIGNINSHTNATPRILNITITDGCGNTGYAVIVQDGYASSTSCSLTFNPGDQYRVFDANVSGTSSNSFTVRSSCCKTDNWTISSNNTNFITSINVSSHSSTAVTFWPSFSANTTSQEPRTALLTITDGCGNTAYCTIVQKGNVCDIDITNRIQIIPATVLEAQTAVSSCCNITSYNITLGNSYASVAYNGGLSGTLKVTFNNANTSEDDRVVIVKITDACGNTGYFIAVQKAKAAAGDAGFAAIGTFVPAQIGYGGKAESQHFWNKVMPVGKYRVYVFFLSTKQANYNWPASLRITPRVIINGVEQDFPTVERGWICSQYVTANPTMAGSHFGYYGSAPSTMGDSQAITAMNINGYLGFASTAYNSKGSMEFTATYPWINGVRTSINKDDYRILGYVRFE